MDHARHMSSPSPTSSFLFQHSDRSFKTNLLTPLLGSVSDVSDVDDCYSANSATKHLHHGRGVDSTFGDTNDDDHERTVLVSDDEHQQFNHDNPSLSDDQHHQAGHHDQSDHCVIIDRDSLNGVDNEDDEVDCMHNMLSGSSTSSPTTMPLLSDGHPHNPFSRISLEEYSPLSLVAECDNALAISPNSLACGPNHPFKTSLSNLKMDNLDGVDVGVHDHDDDVVGADARSMSPSLLSTTTSSLHPHLWSNSSTAITQNPALLGASSGSFLLSHHHHHHHQLSSLMQQLEPQSLDEPPPLLVSSATLDFDQNLLSHRPSSEPLPGSSFDINNNNNNNNHNIETKSVSSQSNASTILLDQPPALKPKVASGVGANKSKANIDNVSLLPASAAPSRSTRRNRNRTVSNSAASQVRHQTNASTSNAKTSVGRTASEKQQSQSMASPFTGPSHCSKVHLQMNHHQKLKELQQRLFGTTTSVDTSQTAQFVSTSKTENKTSDNEAYSSLASTSVCSSEVKRPQACKKEEEADSSAIKQTSTQTRSTSTSTNATNDNTDRARFRRTPRRKTRSEKNDGSVNSSASVTAMNSSRASMSKVVATETAEPDTTTKTSECIKLADLLATTNSVDAKNCNISMMLNNVFTTDPNGVRDQNSNNDKRIQHIQLQVSPSLTVVSNGGLLQPISIQPQQISNNGTIVCSGTLDNQLLCRPITVMTPMSGAGNLNSGINGAQIKCNLVASNELTKDNETALLTGWSNANQQTGTNGAGTGGTGNNGTSTSNNQSMVTNNAGLGTHQIAIQVICQDGTSLVLPVSSAATLNGLTLAPQNQQQLQAVLGGGVSNQQRQQQARNMLPMVSVANIVAQQQTTVNESNNMAGSSNQNRGASRNLTQTSGLAASSPTLAALLDAGSMRGNNCGPGSTTNNGGDINLSSQQTIVSTNLLRKLIGGNQANLDLKRSEINLQPGAGIELADNESLVTVCVQNESKNQTNTNTANNACANAEKRIKLENDAAELGSGKNGAEGAHATFTLAESQGLVVANGNDAGGESSQANVHQTELSEIKASSLGGGQLSGGETSSNGSTTGATLINQLGITAIKSSTTTTTSDTNASKQSKMTSSTGNRQVDPTQPFRCEHCNSTFTRLGNFTRHKKIHTVPIKDGQRFKCDVCSKSFLQRCDLARHLHIHRGTEPHRCNICGKGYIRHSDLVTHQRFHNKEKPFGCPHCSKGFCQRGDLNRHLRSIHLQMKPILCPCCNRKFAKQETLLRHLNTAHRGRPAGQNAVIAEITASNYTIGSGDDKHPTISMLTSAPTVINSTNNCNSAAEQKTVASLEAIQATLCKVQQSADPSNPVKVDIASCN